MARFVDRPAASFVPGGRGVRGGWGGVEGGRYGAWKFLKNESGSEPLARARARGSR